MFISFKNTLPEILFNKIWPNVWAPYGPVRFIHKINITVFFSNYLPFSVTRGANPVIMAPWLLQFLLFLWTWVRSEDLSSGCFLQLLLIWLQSFRLCTSRELWEKRSKLHCSAAKKERWSQEGSRWHSLAGDSQLRMPTVSSTYLLILLHSLQPP